MLFGPFRKLSGQIGEIGLAGIQAQIELAGQESVFDSQQAVSDLVELVFAAQEVGFGLVAVVLIAVGANPQWQLDLPVQIGLAETVIK